MCGVDLIKKKIIALASVVLIAVSVTAGWIHFLGAATHELPGMAIIEDTNGDRIAVEPTSGEVWDELIELYHSKGEMWVGGVVEVFIFIRPDPNYPWGFRFKPENITVAEVTAEGLQTTIRDISEDVDYWIRIGRAYVFAKVVDLARAHVGDMNDDGIVDIFDVVILADAFGSYPGHPNWNPDADLNNDDVLDILDVVTIAKKFGATA